MPPSTLHVRLADGDAPASADPNVLVVSTTGDALESELLALPGSFAISLPRPPHRVITRRQREIAREGRGSFFAPPRGPCTCVCTRGPPSYGFRRGPARLGALFRPVDFAPPISFVFVVPSPFPPHTRSPLSPQTAGIPSTVAAGSVDEVVLDVAKDGVTLS